MDKAREYARKIASYSPTALRFLKHSFNADTEHITGIGNVAFDGLDFFVKSRGGHGGGDRLRREAQARLLALPLRRDGLPRAGEGRRGATTGRHRAE